MRDEEYFTIDRAYLVAQAKEAIRSYFAPLRWLLAGERRPLLVIAIAIAALALSGCATTRYVTVPCISKEQKIPAEPESVKGKLTGEADKDTRILAGGLIRWQSYGRAMRQIVDTCR